MDLACVYAPNCCTSFKESQEYKDLSAHVMSLQDQVNTLFHELNVLRAQQGHDVPVEQPPPAPMQQQRDVSDEQQDDLSQPVAQGPGHDLSNDGMGIDPSLNGGDYDAKNDSVGHSFDAQIKQSQT